MGAKVATLLLLADWLRRLGITLLHLDQQSTTAISALLRATARVSRKRRNHNGF
jgi:hypothetical protein